MTHQASIQPDGTDQCAVCRPGATTGIGVARLRCVLNAGHEGEHVDGLGHQFTDPDHEPAQPYDVPCEDCGRRQSDQCDCAAEHSAAWMLARSDRPAHNPPHEVHQLDSVEELRAWASERDVSVVLISVDAAGARIYAAHCESQTRVAKGPPGQRVWFYGGFQT